MKVAHNKKILAGFLICSVILLVIGIFSFEAGKKFISGNKWVNHTHEVLHEFEKILITSVDATVGERGYIITGEEKFLEPYVTSKAESAKHFNNVRLLAKDSPVQEANIDSMENLFGKLTNFYEQCIALRKTGKEAEAIALLQSGQGIRIEDNIKGIIRNAQKTEEKLLAERIRQSDADANTFRLISILLIAAILIIIGGVYGVITARARIFKKSEESFNKTITDYMFALDESSIVAVTDQKGVIKHVNDNFCKISKYSTSELIGQDHRIINSSYHSKDFIRNIWVTIASGKIWKGELRNKAKDGTIYWVDTTIVPFLNEHGKPYQYMAIRSDITQRKEGEEKILKMNEELEDKVKERTLQLTHLLEREKELNEMKSRFVSMASHEFRTPLTTVLLSIGLVEQYKGEEHEEKRLRHFERIKSSITNLTTILNDFLSLDKLESGKLEAEHTVFDLQKFLEEIIEEMQAVAKKKNQQINYVHNGHTEILQDKKIFRNVMNNLLSNAIKYSPEEKEIHVSSETNGELVSVSVKDNGIGIPEEDQKHLFTTFFRANNAGTIQGTGLGLNIVKKYVELMDGKIYFTSILNKGTTFTVELPANKKLNGNHSPH